MLLWFVFVGMILVLLALDLGVFHRKSRVIPTKEALAWTAVWVSLSFSFSGIIYLAYERGWVNNINDLSGWDAVVKYITGYLVEQSLSMDNVFVIAMIFAYFKVPAAYQHRVLFWGILGAIFFRALMIALGVILIQKFSWMTYVFGVILLFSAYKMARSRDREIQPQRNPVILLLKRFFPVSKSFEGEKFFVRRRHITAATPLFVALVVVETTDIMFAVDSIPAILAITTDPFLVFSSNIFAILGLRSLYFVLASLLDKFRFLKYSLLFILAFVGVKMLLVHIVHWPEWLPLVVIATALTAGIAGSLLVPPKKEKSTPGNGDAPGL